jgi:hypothetical protein
MTGRKARALFGTLGILAGLAGLVNILLERRAAGERRRVLTTLAQDFRERDAPASTESAVVWEGQTFRPGDRVRIAKWAGTFKPGETGAAVQVNAGQGRVGVVVSGEPRKSTDHLRIDPSEPIQIVRVRWLPQRWNAIGPGQPLELPQFEATIHVSYLERIP